MAAWCRLRLDVTDAAQVAAAATAAPDVTVLIDNAGYAVFQGAIAAAVPWATSGIGTFETCRMTLRMSANWGRPEVAGTGSERRC
jgi:Flp pilus assembly protein TadG